LTLLSDGERLTGAYALGPEAGEWLQQATQAIRAHARLDVLDDTIQALPTFSEIYVAALKAPREIAAASKRSAPDPRWRADERSDDDHGNRGDPGAGNRGRRPLYEGGGRCGFPMRWRASRRWQSG
jgi:hypothetical protein